MKLLLILIAACMVVGGVAKVSAQDTFRPTLQAVPVPCDCWRCRAARGSLVPPGYYGRPSYNRPYGYRYDWLYPKYYGAFHSRMIQDYGYPSGDIGLRGRAW